MGQYDTGLTNNPQEVSTNVELDHPNINDDSDSDMEENDQWGGYVPLAQNPNDAEPLDELSASEDEEMNLQELDSSPTSGPSGSIPEVRPASAALVEEVWTNSPPRESDIEMSEKKINLVKQVMLNIQLPTDSIPSWANDIPEEEWKDHLLKRLNKNDK
ncbi:male-enhanced antigen 1 [Anthonomus grandis grandis]|uniref:male-enhanced antigen 1 n=1 Tax=Anthonomus grandis grandis TaxID=2921223 RepID=UPI0021661495|nr:male-enhanced antigen 1 [Anthonomus grandis grandis]